VLETHLQARLRTHGGLTPPALGCAVFVRRGNGDFCDAQMHVQPRAAGVSPPWFGHTIAVSGEANAVQRRANTHPGATFVSPPWLGKRICQYASAKSRETAIGALTNAGAVAVVNPRGANAPRSSVGVRISAGEKRFLRCTNARSQERRSSARRGSVIRSLCRERRMLFSDERIHTQERRSSARRGWGNAFAGTLPQSRGRPPSVRSRTPVQSR
jgi:hypothetical protein